MLIHDPADDDCDDAENGCADDTGDHVNDKRALETKILAMTMAAALKAVMLARELAVAGMETKMVMVMVVVVGSESGDVKGLEDGEVARDGSGDHIDDAEGVLDGGHGEDPCDNVERWARRIGGAIVRKELMAGTGGQISYYRQFLKNLWNLGRRFAHRLSVW